MQNTDKVKPKSEEVFQKVTERFTKLGNLVTEKRTDYRSSYMKWLQATEIRFQKRRNENILEELETKRHNSNQKERIDISRIRNGEIVLGEFDTRGKY